MKTAYATIKGIEVMRGLRKGQTENFYFGHRLRRDASGEKKPLKCKVFNDTKDCLITNFATVPNTLPFPGGTLYERMGEC